MRVRRYPQLWDNCIGAWCPSQGQTGAELRDYSGYALHGQSTSGTTWEAKDSGYSLSLSSSYVSIPNFINVYPTRNITVSLWYRSRTAPTNPYYTSAILSNSSLASPYPGFDIRGVSATEYNIAIAIGGSNNTYALGALSLNAWVHIAFTYDGTNCRTSRNGSLYATTAASGSIDVPTTTSLRVGDNPAFTPRYFDGHVDDIRIYSRALSQGEVATLASRRGIAYETKPRPLPRKLSAATFKSAWAINRSQILGAR